MKNKELTELIRTLLMNVFPEERRSNNFEQRTHSTQYFSISAESMLPSYLHERPHESIRLMMDEKRKAEMLLFSGDVQQSNIAYSIATGRNRRNVKAIDYTQHLFKTLIFSIFWFKFYSQTYFITFKFEV